MAREAETTWTIGALLRWTESYFARKGIESPRLDAQVLLAHVLNCPRIALYTRTDEEPPESERARFRELVKQRVAGCPVAYLVGFKEFYLLKFEVSPEVLIPRPATEALVLAARDEIRVLSQPHVLDLATGSGCVAIALAFHCPGARFVATDLSPASLEVARRNAATHGVSQRVEFLVSDLFGGLAGRPAFDLIVSNPPYIPTEDLPGLPVEVREHEPRLALDGGHAGLDVIRRLVADAAPFLRPGGLLMFEMGMGQDPAVQELFHASGAWEPLPTHVDGDGIPRVAAARRKRST